MLKQLFRFHGHNSLRYVYKHGEIVRSRSMAIKFAKNPKRPNSRCAVVVSRKVLKSAPKRNRVRRRIYEVIRENWDRLKPSMDIVVLVYEPRFYDMPPEELKESVLSLLERAELFSS